MDLFLNRRGKAGTLYVATEIDLDVLLPEEQACK